MRVDAVIAAVLAGPKVLEELLRAAEFLLSSATKVLQLLVAGAAPLR